MSVTAFNRVYELILGVSHKKSDVLPSDPNALELVIEAERPPGGILIEPPMDIGFTIKKTSDNSPNTLNLKIYNLNKSTAKKLEKYSSDNYVVLLRVGYGSKDNLGTLYYGGIQNLWTEWEGSDRITNVECGTQTVEGRTPILKGYGTGINKDKLKIITDAFGVRLVEKLPDQLEIDLLQSNVSNGYCLYRSAEDELTNVLSQFGYTWTVDDGILKFIPHDKSSLVVDKSRAVLLTPKTGLIGSPSRNLLKKGKKDIVSRVLSTKDSLNAVAFSGGLKLKSLLNPKIVPGKILKVESQEMDLYCVAHECNYAGEFRGDSWDVDIEAVEIIQKTIIGQDEFD